MQSKSSFTLSRKVFNEIKQYAVQINQAFWNTARHNHLAPTAAAVLNTFQNEFTYALKEPQLSPKKRVVLLNLQLQCAVIASLSNPLVDRLNELRCGIQKHDASYAAETIFVLFNTRRSARFYVEFRSRKEITVWLSHKTATWSPVFYYHLGEKIPYLLAKKTTPEAVEQKFQEQLRRHTRAMLPSNRIARNSAPELLSHFHYLNHQFFDGQIEEVVVRWGRWATRKLGHWNEVQREIVISPLLKMPEVPEFVLQTILYHEMLHIIEPPYYKNGRWHKHHREFRRRERAFIHYQRTRDWLESNWQSLVHKYSSLRP